MKVCPRAFDRCSLGIALVVGLFGSCASPIPELSKQGDGAVPIGTTVRPLRSWGASTPAAAGLPPGSKVRPLAYAAAVPAAAQDGELQEDPPHFEPVTSRWFAPGYPLKTGTGRTIPLPEYEINRPGSLWNPYRQNPLKGDFPIAGTEDVFLNLTATSRTIVEQRNAPTRSGNSGPGGSVNTDFFGRMKQGFFAQDVSLTLDLFKGQQAFKPVDWRLKVTPVINRTDLSVSEIGFVTIDPSEGRSRQRDDVALQEYLLEYHLFDLNNRYDFISSEVGVFPFRSDFRGFIFDDVNRGARLFGTADNNRWQWNLVAYDMVDKDTNSLLNNTQDREQEVFIANIYRQDWPVLGYTTSFSVHYNNDHRGLHFDDNGFLVSPAAVGAFREHEVQATYLGTAGEGHFGRLNMTHALYTAFGKDSFNPISASEQDIEAYFGALELSYDFDWFRVRGYGLYASGDSDARDGKAEGFDAILDAPNFAGGPLSFFNGQAIGLVGTALTGFQSFLPDLQTNKFEGQSNFVNPGLLLLGAAVDVEITPKARAQFGSNYLLFQETDPLETYLELGGIDKDLGAEVFLGIQYRPYLNNNMILTLAGSAFQPGEGFARIYEDDDMLYALNLTLLLTY